MDILSNISDNINIGSNNVMEVAKYASGLKCGGLLEYTHTKGILKNNMRKNFNSGSRYRSSITCSFPPYKDCLPENRRDFTDGRGVGDLYGIDGLETSAEHKFLTKKEFLEMHDCILKEITKNNKAYNEKLRNVKYLTAPSYLRLKESLSEGNRVTFTYNNDLGTNITLVDDLDENALKGINNARMENSDLFSKLGKLKRLQEEYGSLKPSISEYKKLSRKDISDKIYARIPQFQKSSRARLFFSNAQSMISGLQWDSKPWNTEDVTIPSLGHITGLYTFNSSYRDAYKSTLPNILYPKDGGKWTIGNQYGVTNKKDEWDFYSFGKNNVTYGNVSINTDFRADYRTKNLNNSRQYRYYNENNVDNLSNVSIADDTSVDLDSADLKSPLLRKTNNLFKELKIGSLINRFHTDTKDINEELMHGADSEYGLSRGRNLFNTNRSDRTQTGFANPYCRTWTAHYQYSQLKHGIRPLKDKGGSPLGLRGIQNNLGSLRPNNGGGRLADYTVLQDNGLVKITPTRDDFSKESFLKQYMFSIENLAWRDANKALTPSQKGDYGGRIMWFPPYNLRFSENINVSWNAQNFIGRGEEMYTYSNTVRSGTLDFTLLIDHPSILNRWRGAHQLGGEEKQKREEALLRFFAGEGMLEESEEITKETNSSVSNSLSTTPKNNGQTKRIKYVIFFPYNFSGKNVITEEGGMDTFEDIMSSYNSGGAVTPDDVVDRNLETPAYTYTGANGNTQAFYKEMRIDEYEKDRVTVKFFNAFTNLSDEFKDDKIFGLNRENVDQVACFITGCESDNESIKETPSNIARNRAQTIKKYILKSTSEIEKIEFLRPLRYKSSNNDSHDYDSEQSKISRMVEVDIWVKWKASDKNKTEETNSEKNISGTTFEKSFISTVTQESSYTYDNEYLYFSELENENKIVHKYIVDKIRYFDPVFHSITPEGFNARLTFLHQCTRQGPTTAVSGGEVKSNSEDFLKFAGNLAFGRPPYCILRIGDFFHTKICIDSISIQYDNSGVQWDMNPEGIGLQPMYANISVSFKFLGGQDISGPVERLQNAVTSNFYANASVYSNQADNATHYYDAIRDSMIEKQ